MHRNAFAANLFAEIKSMASLLTLDNQKVNFHYPRLIAALSIVFN